MLTRKKLLDLGAGCEGLTVVAAHHKHIFGIKEVSDTIFELHEVIIVHFDFFLENMLLLS